MEDVEKMRQLEVEQDTLIELQTMKRHVLCTLDAITSGMNIAVQLNPLRWYNERKADNFYANLHLLKVRMDDFTFSYDGIFYESKKIEGISELDRCYQKWHVEIVGLLRCETWNSETLGKFREDILSYCKELKALC